VAAWTGGYVAINDRAEQLKHLVRNGKARSYILYDEIDELLPKNYEGGPELEDILSELSGNGIELLEEPTSKRHKDSEEDDGFLEGNAVLALDEHPGDAVALRMYLRELQSVPHLTRDEEIELAKCIGRGERDAEDAMRRLIEANLRIVVATSKRYTNRGLGILELIQEGNIGLMKAAQRFDVARGYRFSTYAIWWVRQAIMRATPGK
jgi:RNA polymerase primary sigma factor